LAILVDAEAHYSITLSYSSDGRNILLRLFTVLHYFPTLSFSSTYLSNIFYLFITLSSLCFQTRKDPTISFELIVRDTKSPFSFRRTIFYEFPIPKIHQEHFLSNSYSTTFYGLWSFKYSSSDSSWVVYSWFGREG